jgi:hypothetical protein
LNECFVDVILIKLSENKKSINQKKLGSPFSSILRSESLPFGQGNMVLVLPVRYIAG